MRLPRAFATLAGVPAATMRPPASPAPGPTSIAQSSGQPLAPVSDELAASVAAQTLGERLQSELFFEALRRTL